MNLLDFSSELHEWDSQLKERNASGMLIDFAAELANMSHVQRLKFAKDWEGSVPSVLALNDDANALRRDSSLPMNIFGRYRYKGNFRDLYGLSNYMGPYDLPFWKHHHGRIFEVTFPDIDDLGLEPGLHVPDKVFLERIWLRRELALWASRSRGGDAVFPHYLEQSESLPFFARVRRKLFSNTPDVQRFDNLMVRPFTLHENHCLMSFSYELDYASM